MLSNERFVCLGWNNRQRHYPNFGASLQILKVEIGGDTQSTDGTEASHMHYKGDENYKRGYEWWLMQEAKKRNPDIKLSCLPWGFPSWIGEGTQNPYINPQQTADYVVSWIREAKKVYNLTMDYVGIWNERPYDINYIKILRKTLDEQGCSNTLIIAADIKWEIAGDVLKDQNLASVVHAIGCHYPGTTSTSEAKMTKKSLWSSEDYSTYNDEVGGGCWARILSQNYVNGLMTSTISWNLIASYYKYLPFYRDGLMTAVEPWSGNYNVSTPIWMTAHTTQFVNIGWRYLSHDAGVGKLPDGGSYVSLTDAASDELTIIIETMSHDHSKCIRPELPPYKVSPQTITIWLKGSFADVKTLNVWYSKLVFDNPEHILFQKKEPLTFTDGKAQLSLGVDEIYTLSTIKTGNKGAHPNPPQSSPFPQVVSDMFEEYPENSEPNYLAPQIGSLEVRNVNGKRVARQTVLQRPVYWCDAETAEKTISVIGDFEWSEMRFTVWFAIPANNGTSGVFVAVRVDRGGCQVQNAQGIFFFVFPSTRKFIVSNDIARKYVLKEGWLPSATYREHVISLEIHKGVAIGKFDSRQAFNISAPETPKNGFAAVGTDNYGYIDLHQYLLQGPQTL
ncbi:hypothetical protein RRG08_016697 [Elysia crispata]|uniref:galactosylceramidase n=1 Tax=Elysia crispata TaxID=231223 RepID=A0AAE0YIE2_9GAST|nr:hypothetical protein RRG08_016697 [Elysia crispata]